MPKIMANIFIALKSVNDVKKNYNNKNLFIN